MKRRIFIAINLPDAVKSKLIDYQREISSSFEEIDPVNWTRSGNLHITLDFVGDLTDEELAQLCLSTKASYSKKFAFTVNLNQITYGPPNKMPPRMIWVTGDKIKELGLTPHITLGRIKAWQFRKIDPEIRPDINREINLSFDAKSIEVMESVLKKGGPTYTVMESVPLKS